VIAIIFAVRRCHDIDISGWWNLLIAVPLVNIAYGLFLVLKPGTEGANRFGPPRTMPGWEKVVGIIGAVIMVGGILFLIVTLTMTLPAMLEQAGPPG
jgi:hypothetical protein